MKIRINMIRYSLWIHWKLLEFENFYRKTSDFHWNFTRTVHVARWISRTYRNGVGATEGSYTRKSWCLTEYFQVFCTIWMKIRINLMICIEFIENFLNSKISLEKRLIFISPWLAVHVVHFISRTYRNGVGAKKGVSPRKSWCLIEHSFANRLNIYILH